MVVIANESRMFYEPNSNREAYQGALMRDQLTNEDIKKVVESSNQRVCLTGVLVGFDVRVDRLRV